MKKLKEIKIITSLHKSTKRNYIKRMIDNKVHCMKIAKKYGKEYWDGNRKYGYGGYKYIEGRWTAAAKKIIKTFKLKENSRIIDIGCGKGFLLYEIKKIIPKIKICGLDISNYGLKNSHPEIKKYLINKDIKKILPFRDKSFDLCISIGCLHNLEINELFQSIREINRVSKNQYIAAESYRNDKELFNLQCWALTCNSFLSKKEWHWVLKTNNFKGSYELIYFE